MLEQVEELILMNRYETGNKLEELVGFSLAVVGIAVVWGFALGTLADLTDPAQPEPRFTRWWRDELLRIRQRLRHGLWVA